MKKRSLRFLSSGALLGAVLGLFLFLMYSPASASFFEVLRNLIAALISGAVAAVLFALLFFVLDAYRSHGFASFREGLSAQGNIVFEDNATLVLDGKNHNGWMFLTEDALYFRSNGKADSEFDRTVALSSLIFAQSEDPRKSQFSLLYTEGETEVTLFFNVYDVAAWLSVLPKEQPADAVEKENL